MVEVLLALVVAAGVGWLRPRWSSMWIAVAPAVLAFAWFLLHEDVPGYPVGLEDIIWFVGMSVVVGPAFALACGLGISARRASRRRRAPRSL